MAIVFPASPSTNDTFTAGSITYKWDGAKWIGLGVTPIDRLIEGSNKLEIDANNNLVWTGNNVGIGTDNPAKSLSILSSQSVMLQLESTSTTARIGFRVPNTSSSPTIGVDNEEDLQIRTGGNESLRIDSDGKLLKGWGSTAFSGTGQSSDIAIAGTSSNNGLQVIRYNTSFGAYGLTIGRSKNGTIGTHGQVVSGNDIGFVSFVASDGTNWRGCADIAANADGNITSTSAEGKLIFKTTKSGSTTPTQAMTIKANHNVEIHDGNLVFETAGTGIDFSANANATGMSSELLDDYEEGSYLPGWLIATGVTYTSQIGQYVKIGTQVTVWGEFSFTTFTSFPNGWDQITMPFIGAKVSGAFGSYSSNYWAVVDGGTNQVSGHLNFGPLGHPQGTAAAFTNTFLTGNNGLGNASMGTIFTSSTSTKTIRFHMCYTVG
jgi:hypothetical protein